MYKYGLRTVPTNTDVFLRGFVYDCVGKGIKQILARAIEIQKPKLRLTMHFFEIIKQQFIILKNSKIHLAMDGVLSFFQIEALLSLKNAWLPQIFFLDIKSTC